MNNNSNGKGKESDIITKKGFLISLPGKKKSTPDGESSINLAKPNNNKPEAKAAGNAENNGAGTKKKDKYQKFDKKNPKNNRDNHHNENKNKTEENQQARPQKSEGKPQKSEGKPQQNNDERRQNKDKNKSFDKKHNKGHSHNSQDSGNRGASVAHSNQHGENKNHKNDKRESGENRNGGKKRHDRDAKMQKAEPLSSLSKEISSPVKMKNDTVISKPALNELSLEEKFKNAKPLAEQIAEQELRNKGIRIPYDNEKAPSQDADEKQEIVGIRFREAGKIYYFDPDGKTVPFGTPVIVETARGSEYGITAISNRLIPVASLTAPLKKIERIATETDTQKHIANKDLEKDAEEVFKEKVEKLNLPMNLIYVEYTFDNTRLLFYFTAETRIDFRELVKELASVFRTRIELRQIGVRDEAKVLGGLGVCGRAICCNTFLGDFAQVSIKMAKDQSLSLNAAKISGACGKLMCCLRYEDKVYEEENARTPKVGSIVETPEGKGHVVERNALKGIVNVLLDQSPEAPAKPFGRDEVLVIGFNKEKGERDDVGDDLDELKDEE